MFDGLIFAGWCLGAFALGQILALCPWYSAVKRAALMWITDRLPVERIAHQGRPFLDRFHVGRGFGLQVYLHHIYGDDPDGLHDHPWKRGGSIVLLGEYVEHNRFGLRLVRMLNRVDGDHFHRITLLGEPECWTLFWHTARCKPWGFLRPKFGDRANGLLLDSFVYEPVSDDFAGRPFGEWHRYAITGRELRRRDEIDAQLGVA